MKFNRSVGSYMYGSYAYLNVRRVSTSTEFFDFQHLNGGSIIFDMRSFQHSTINIISRWDDSCSVRVSEDDKSSIDVSHDAEKKVVMISGKYDALKNTTLTSYIPENIDIIVVASNLRLSLKNKIQGDLNVSCASGDVRIEKIRSEKIVLDCPDADVRVDKVLEGKDVAVTAKTFSGTKLHVDQTELTIKETVDISALYCRLTSVNSGGSITIGSIHGDAQIRNTSGDVSLSGLQGAYEVSALKGDILMQINSLLGDGVKAEADAGNLCLVVNPEVRAAVHLRGGEGVVVSSRVFVRDEIASSDNDIKGYLSEVLITNPTEKIANSKRPLTSGKVSVQDAKIQAMQGYQASQSAACIVGVASGSIKMETVSWMDALRKKHGLAS